MIDPMRDLETVAALRQVKDREYVEATYALRIDFHCPAPLSHRPAKLDPFLVRAAQIMGDSLTYYEAEGQDFAGSRGRKPRASDIAQLGQFSQIMAVCEERKSAEKVARRAHIEKHTGKPTLDINFPPSDGGVLILAQNGREQETTDGIVLLGFGYWRVSLSFGPDTARNNWDAILQLAQDLMVSGIPAGATFGYALNVKTGLPPDLDQRYFQPPTRRFQMLHPIGLAKFGFFPRTERAVLPPACWYVIEDEWAIENGLDPAAFRALADQVYSVTETPNGVLVKLFEMPTLGDLHDAPDLSPAYALGAVLKPAMENAWAENHLGRTPHGLGGISVGEMADRLAFYTRFAQKNPNA